MPALSKNEATERLARVVEKSNPGTLTEIYSELFPDKNPSASQLSAIDLAEHVRRGLEAEEIVDLWNVVFPMDRNVWYDEEDGTIRHNDEAISYAE